MYNSSLALYNQQNILDHNQSSEVSTKKPHKKKQGINLYKRVNYHYMYMINLTMHAAQCNSIVNKY